MKPLTGISKLGDNYTATCNRIVTNIQNGNMHAHKRIAGIPCHDDITTEKMLEFFTDENLKISLIKDKLETAGLPFKAIVPTAFYNEIKRKKKVYTFRNINDEGFASISQAALENFVVKEERTFNKLTQAAIIALSLIVCLPLMFLSEYYTWQWQLINNSTVRARRVDFALFNIVIIIVMLLANWGIREGLQALCSFFNTTWLKKRVITKLNKNGSEIFWPEYRDDTSGSTGSMVKVDFIKPDSESIPNNILQWKKAGHEVQISAQEEAFSVNISSLEIPLQSIFNEIDKKKKELRMSHIEARRAFWERLWSSDPIISAEEGEYTVLIDAYGGKSFVSEKEVIEGVTGYYNEKLKQFQTFLN